MKLPRVLLLLVFATSSAFAAHPAFDTWLEAFTLEWVRANPTLSTGKEYFSTEEQDELDARLTPVTREYQERQAARARAALAELQGFDRASLSPTQRISASTLRWQLEEVLSDLEFFDYFYPFNQIIGAQSGIVLFLTNTHPIRRVRDGENYLARVRQIPAMIDDLIAETRRRESERGVRAPRFLATALPGLDPARVRFVPIAMTSLATIVGLLPTALGYGEAAASNRPLALAVVGGLSSSTMISLFLIPVLFVALARRASPESAAPLAQATPQAG